MDRVNVFRRGVVGIDVTCEPVSTMANITEGEGYVRSFWNGAVRSLRSWTSSPGTVKQLVPGPQSCTRVSSSGVTGNGEATTTLAMAAATKVGVEKRIVVDKAEGLGRWP